MAWVANVFEKTEVDTGGYVNITFNLLEDSVVRYTNISMRVPADVQVARQQIIARCRELRDNYVRAGQIQPPINITIPD